MKQTQEERTTSSIVSLLTRELDVESGASSNAGQLGIANMRSGSIHGELRKETLLIEVRDDIEFTEVGAT